MLHFSKLFTRGTQVIQSEIFVPWFRGAKVQATAAKRVDGSILLVLHNQSENSERVQIESSERSVFEIFIEPFSLTSVIFYPELI